MKVLIIGAGTGGLALAHRLQLAGIEVEVFERNRTAMDGLAGYGIHLNADGWGALRRCLPEALFQLLDSRAGHAGTILNFRTERLERLCVRDDAAILNVGSDVVERRSIGRLQLRKLLLTGLAPTTVEANGVVRFSKEFMGYESGANGVTTHFADGTHAAGDVLVGADASHSRVRQQYLPHLGRVDLGIATIAGRLPLHSGMTSALPSFFTDGSLNNIVSRGSDWMFVSSWLAARSAGTAISDPEQSSYLVWAYAAREVSYGSNLEACNGEQLRDMVLTRIADWSPTLRAAVESSDPATIKPVRLKSMPTLDHWNPSQVTLIGDAIHNMTPMAGIGANTALRDAAELGDRLAQSNSDPASIQNSIAAYEDRMREYANRAVALSRGNAERATNKRGRLMFRTVLRVAERVPWLKSRLFAKAL
jgi:2-polyprenyl-6-methoxyphenol hydroxylase-like FAD-dependent oxidoreductase